MKRLGLVYENLVAAAIPQAQHGLWFAFWDSRGPGYCSPDLVLDLPEATIVIECKLSWVPEAHSQILQLYLPVLEHARGKPCLGLVVVKHLSQGAPLGDVCRGLSDGVSFAKQSGRCAILHWPRPAPPHSGKEPGKWVFDPLAHRPRGAMLAS